MLLGALLAIPVLVGAGVYHCGRNLEDFLLILKTSLDQSDAKLSKHARAADIAEIINKVPVVLGTARAAGAGSAGSLAAGVAVDVIMAGTATGVVDVGVVAGIAAGVGGVMITAGAVAGGVIGAKAAKDANSPGEAAEMAAGAIIDGVKKLF